MEQDELERNKLKHLSGCETKRMLEKKGITEPVTERSIKVKNGLWIKTKEAFVSEERDEELRQNYLNKLNNRTARVFF